MQLAIQLFVDTLCIDYLFICPQIKVFSMSFMISCFAKPAKNEISFYANLAKNEIRNFKFLECATQYSKMKTICIAANKA